MRLERPDLFRYGILLAILVIGLDQASKWYVLDVFRLPDKGMVELLPFFNLTMVWNYGISFGMLSHPGTGVPIFLSLAAAIIVTALLFWLARAQDRLMMWAIGMVIGGAVSNVIDRARFGAVADFFDVHAFGYHWPAFNIADSAIFIGVMLLLWDGLARGKRKP